MTVLAVVGSTYGALHAIAWSAPFANESQKILWRVSCVVVIVPFAVLLLTLVAVLVLACVKSMSYWRVWSKLRRTFKSMLRSESEEKLMCCIRTVARKVTAVAASAKRHFRSVAPGAFFIGAGLFSIVYALARIYLVVECFINLAQLPEAVYKEPEWSKIFPHLGSG